VSSCVHRPPLRSESLTACEVCLQFTEKFEYLCEQLDLKSVRKVPGTVPILLSRAFLATLHTAKWGLSPSLALSGQTLRAESTPAKAFVRYVLAHLRMCQLSERPFEQASTTNGRRFTTSATLRRYAPSTKAKALKVSDCGTHERQPQALYLGTARFDVRVCPESAGDCPHFSLQSVCCDTSYSKMGTVPLALALSGQTLS
jgi:hypothetical protein